MIYILDNDTALIAQALDDRSLSRMISSIAQVLCNVHWMQPCKNGTIEDVLKEVEETFNIPLRYADPDNCKWSQWTRQCLANYNYLVELGMRCLDEYWHRFIHQPDSVLQLQDYKNKKFVNFYNKQQHVIEWAKLNVPEFSIWPFEAISMTELPLAMPEKFNLIEQAGMGLEAWFHRRLTIQSYQQYYAHKLQKGLRRVKKHSVPDYMGGTTTPDPIIPKFSRREKPEWLKLEDA